MRPLILNEISQVSGGNYTPRALELSGAGSIIFGTVGGISAGLTTFIMKPASDLSFTASANALELVLSPTLPIPVAILIGIGVGSTVGTLLGLSLYSIGFEIMDPVN